MANRLMSSIALAMSCTARCRNNFVAAVFEPVQVQELDYLLYDDHRSIEHNEIAVNQMASRCLPPERRSCEKLDPFYLDPFTCDAHYWCQPCSWFLRRNRVHRCNTRGIFLCNRRTPSTRYAFPTLSPPPIFYRLSHWP